MSTDAMRILWTSTVALALLALGPGAARADGLLYQLPEDGAWVRFDLEGTRGPEGMELRLEGSLTMASVGRVRAGGEDCRWIELEWHLKQKKNEVRLITKLLIPEKYLQQGENPVEHIVRGWAKLDNGAPEDVNKNRVAPHFLPGALAGPLQEVKKLDTTEIESKLGRLECEGLTGYTEYEVDQFEIRTTFQTRLNEEAPFGVVSARVSSRTRHEGDVTLAVTDNLRLADFGKDATSALPGHN